MKFFEAWLIILYTFWPLLSQASADVGSAVESNATAAKSNNSQLVTVQAPLAEKLVRFRRQPPVTIIKHIVRSSKRSKPRRRIKRPKVRYGPPPPQHSPSTSYAFDDQLSYFKPQSHFSTSNAEAPSFSFDEFQNLKLDAADFELPPSSYEAQSMDLDFYSQSDDEMPAYQSISKLPTLADGEYGSSDTGGLELEHNVETGGGYAYKPKQPRKPHQKYGLPMTLDYASDFNAESPSYFPNTDYSSYNSYQTEGGGGKYQAPESHAPTHISSSHYNTIHSDTADEDDVYGSSRTYGASPPKRAKEHYNPPVSSAGSYNIYDKKIPNSGYEQSYEQPHYIETEPTGPPAQSADYSHNFDTQHHQYEHAQPPQLPPTKSAVDIEFTYSPSYEVNLLTPNQPGSGTQQQHHPPSNNHHGPQPGNFAEPPPEQSVPPVNTYHVPQQPGAIDDYVPPTQELPLNPHHKQPAYDFPKSSYEVPIYDPIPFDASNNDEQEFYPPHQNQAPEESRHQETSFPSNYQSNQAASEIASHTAESDLSPKSSIKHSQRQRHRNPLGSSTKHTLDVPELKKAYDAAKQNAPSHFPTRQTDADVNASTYIEEKQAFLPTQPGTIKQNYFSQTWNPMRLKTPTHLASVSMSTDRPESSLSSSTTSKSTKPQFRPRAHLTATATPTPIKLPAQTKANRTAAIEVISIEKSHSQSYYDGTVAPPLNMSNLYNTRLNKFKTPARSSTLKPASLPKQPSTQRPYKDVPAAKRTTKSIFDTTHFKAPQNERDAAAASVPYGFAQTLPKNHKLF